MSVARLGLTLPVLIMSAGNHSDWERDGTIEDVAEAARVAERLGFDHVQCSEHVVIPPEQAERRGGRYYDPLAVFGYLSAVTSKIRFVTSVLVLGYHHPMEIAKRYGTLDVVSGGRLVLGLGVGSLKPEFDLLGLGGAEFEERGARGDDALKALRVSLGRRMPEYHGRYYDYQDLIVDPCALQQDMQLWIGGRSLRSLRRAVELADGWMPFSLGAEESAAMLARARELPSWSAREQPIEVVLTNNKTLDPMGAPDVTLDIVRSLLAAGATKLRVSFASRSPAHHTEQMEAMASLMDQV